MSTLPPGLRPNTQEVAAEIIDGEVIIINLSTGIYYSTSGIGAVVWAGIEGAHGLNEILATIVARYDVSPERAEADVKRLATQLLEKRLVGAAEPRPLGEPKPEPDPESRRPYEPPTLHVYRDMGALLALDPPSPLLKDTPWSAPANPA